MKDIAIYGAGGLGREIACVIKRINERKLTWNFIGFFDDGIVKGVNNEYGMIIGGISDLNNYSSPIALIFGIANPQIVYDIHQKIILDGISYPNIIAPDVTFMDENNYNIGKGNFINVGCLISCNVKIGDFNSMGAFSSLGHDTTLDSFNIIMPSTQICGYVMVGNLNFFGINSIVLQQLKVGEYVTIGCNSVLMSDAKDYYTYWGTPARTITKKREDGKT